MVAEERPRITLTTAFSTLFSGLGLSPRAVSTSFGSRANVAICTQVRNIFSIVCFYFLIAGQGRTIKCRETKKQRSSWASQLANQFIMDIKCTNHVAKQAGTRCGKMWESKSPLVCFLWRCVTFVSYWPIMWRGNFKPIAMKEIKPSCFFFVPSRERPHPRRPVYMLTREHCETTG